MANFSVTQGRYISFIHTYTELHGYPPAESEIAAALCVSPPSVNQMVKTLEKKGLILRQPGMPRSLRVLVPEDEIPSWRRGGDRGKSPSHMKEQPSREAVNPASPPANLYVLAVYLMGGLLHRLGAWLQAFGRQRRFRGDSFLDDSGLHTGVGRFGRILRAIRQIEVGGAGDHNNHCQATQNLPGSHLGHPLNYLF